VRRGTRELLARIRQERIARADKSVRSAVEEHHHEQPAPSAGLMPDPLITRLSEQLIAKGLISASATDPVPQSQSQSLPHPVAVPAVREASAPGRITRHYDSARLGISPVNKDDATLTLDLSVSRPTRGGAEAQQRFAKLAGLQPFEPMMRGANSAHTEPGAAAAANPVQQELGGAMPGIETVPTLGPGLIWRLSQAGISTMADLAACDAASIRSKLGQLGRLVKVEDWIAHARAVVADPAFNSSSTP
jgi:predicted flap endonuclease-1-like 5' DNA nuclease